MLQRLPTAALLRLAFQSLGIVYGDLGTSPLYVFRSTFPTGLRKEAHEEEVMGALSLIILTLTLIPLIKYMFIVLRADDNGEGVSFLIFLSFPYLNRIWFSVNDGLSSGSLTLSFPHD